MQALSTIWPRVAKPILGVIHVLPLPGSPRYGGDITRVFEHVLADAAALAEGGAHSLVLENFGDAPFYPARVPTLTAAHMTALACQVRRRIDLPLGINVLRNDGQTALAVAHAAGAEFIRVNVLCGVRVTDQGVIEGIAHRLLRERAALGAAGGRIKIFADIDVKHSAPLTARPLVEEARETLERGLADALILSGTATGGAVDRAERAQLRAALPKAAVLICSGLTEHNAADYLEHADGAIAGTWIKRNADLTQPVDSGRVSRLVAAAAGGDSR